MSGRVGLRTEGGVRTNSHGADHPAAGPYRRRTTCRSCGSSRLARVLELGPQPLANALPRSPAEFAAEKFYALDVCFCEECALVQVPDVIDPETLFRDYIYVTGTSETIAQHNERYARAVVEATGASAGDLVVEIASNDGSLLRCFGPYGVRTLGVEPATNIAGIARAAGIETVNEFFDAETAASLRTTHGAAKAVLANNVLAHVDDTAGFLRGVRTLLADDGLAMIEVPYLGDLLDQLEYDTVYHEHLCYFSATTLVGLCETAGLAVRRIDRVPVHGGSIRVYAGIARGPGGHSDRVRVMVENESARGFNRLALYEDLATDVAANRTALLALLDRLRADGRRVAGYGAPAKGNTLLNYCGIGPDRVAFTVDRNPLKVGRYTPGTHIPILPVEALLEQQPDFVLILAWNFAEEIMAQQAEYRRRGGRFILPIPQPRMV
ncbi:MAG: class I SAM-dependent methyltransferase [Gemmatimonadetes bacterium]|nr:class I SAM-dependent methyltransferase [Gemmatimonadota bacterium]